MPTRTGTAHVVTTTRKYKDQVYRTHLLRRSYREGGTVKNETLGNLSHLPDALIDIIRRSLQGETFVPLAQAFEITRSRPHGHVQAAVRRLEHLAPVVRVERSVVQLVLYRLTDEGDVVGAAAAADRDPAAPEGLHTRQ